MKVIGLSEEVPVELDPQGSEVLRPRLSARQPTPPRAVEAACPISTG